jgi:hypothetical protein
MADYLGANDLGAFIQAAQGANPYSHAAQGIAQWQPDMTTWSPTASGVGSFAKAFLGSLLGNYAQQQTAQQAASVVKLLPQLNKDPMMVETPEGVNPAAFSMLQGSAYMKNQARQATRDDALAAQGIVIDPNSSVSISDQVNKIMGDRERTKAQAEVEGKMAGYGAVKDASKIPGTPQYEANKENLKTLDDVRKSFEDKPEVKTYSVALKAAEALSGALKDNRKTSDLELVRYAIQMIEPGLSVREGEQKAVEQSTSIPEALKGQMRGALGGTELGPDVREGIKALASRALQSHTNAYNKTLNYYQTLAQERGQPSGKSISYLGAAPSVESVFGKITIPPDVLRAERDAIKKANPQLSGPEIAARLRTKYGAVMGLAQ